ncbi:MAG: sigma 54-interacting transcriptional regulator [Gemmatimonadales bacterium]|nr:sigma 54-interacting transcriptional regulator [Gemmatimonadales bacterium]
MDLVALHSDLEELLRDLAVCLRQLVDFDVLAFVLPRAGGQAADIYTVLLAAPGAPPSATSVESVTIPSVHETRLASLWAGQAPVVLSDIEGERDYPEMVAELRQRGKRSSCLLPLSTALRPVGIIAFASPEVGAYDEADLGLLQQVASQVAVAVDNVRHNEEALESRRQLEAERDHWRTLLEFSNAVVTNIELGSLLAAITPNLRQIVPHDYTMVALIDDEGRRLTHYALDPALPAGIAEVIESSDLGQNALLVEALASRKPLAADPRQLPKVPEPMRRRFAAVNLQATCIVPLVTPRRTLGALWLGRRDSAPFRRHELDGGFQAAGQIAIALENALAFAEIAALKDRLARENVYLEDEIRGSHNFEEIVGESRALQGVLAKARSVAPTDTNVLLLGETGTGKELVARAIHSMSARRSRTLVTVNCATSPAGLLESEWFGHEKGAFTGAVMQKVGRFELAHQGTLFLDEVGDIPLDLQSKLLRALQEHEIERLGSTRSIRVDFRLVAATNRDLPAMVADREYRADLYYRLNVFPIRLPPLRERPEDIPLLVRYFVQRYAKRLHRPIDAVPRETMNVLCRWSWPGNVRELQNVIERAVILSHGPTLRVPHSDFEQPAAVVGSPRTLEEAEREHVVRALESTEWVIGGSSGAAARLGLKRTTLVSIMKRLGIARPKPR